MDTSDPTISMNPVISVEGKSDHAFLEQALETSGTPEGSPSSLSRPIRRRDVKGGVEELLKYIKLNTRSISARATEAPVIVLLDWDSGKKKQDFESFLTTRVLNFLCISRFQHLIHRLRKLFMGLSSKKDQKSKKLIPQ